MCVLAMRLADAVTADEMRFPEAIGAAETYTDERIVRALSGFLSADVAAAVAAGCCAK